VTVRASDDADFPDAEHGAGSWARPRHGGGAAEWTLYFSRPKRALAMVFFWISLVPS
jgi:hypothetical protein